MINYDLTQIRAIVFDVDGVLSCSTIPMDSRGEPVRTINIKDGYAIQLAEKHGLRIAIMTGGHNEDIRLRYEYLGVEDVYLSCAVKVRTWEAFKERYGLRDEEIVYAACWLRMLSEGCLSGGEGHFHLRQRPPWWAGSGARRHRAGAEGTRQVGAQCESLLLVGT